jgi:MoaA/NifB/PqqE/SkfB family radical SAM enzyme
MTHVEVKAKQEQCEVPLLEWKLWIYTNYDCNLTCKYCVAKSGPNVPRRALGADSINRLVDEAKALGFEHVFMTGGEPFLLNDIYDILAYSSARIPTTVLTNATLLHHRRLDKLDAIRNANLVMQVSLDGARAEHHDAYRGRGTWARTVDGIRMLQQRGYRVRIGTTETPVNSAHLDELRAFLLDLGIPPDDHFVRPLARRGFSKEGIELSLDDLEPELTVNIDGVYWHPLSTDSDMLVSKRLFPLKDSIDHIMAMLSEPKTGARPRKKFT